MLVAGTTPLLATSDKQDLYSMAYISAVIASSGFNMGGLVLDRAKEDIHIRHQIDADFTPTYQRLNIQVKCTYEHNINQKTKAIHYPLDVDTYNKLRLPHIEPHIIVVVLVPRPDKEPWLECVDHHTILRHRAYWLSLNGLNESKNTDNVTIQIPEKNTFDTVAVHYLMNEIAKGNKRL